VVPAKAAKARSFALQALVVAHVRVLRAARSRNRELAFSLT